MNMFALTIMAMMIMVLLANSTAFAEIINFDEAKSGQLPES